MASKPVTPRASKPSAAKLAASSLSSGSAPAPVPTVPHPGLIRAILLAGGYGTRMQPLSWPPPKVLLPIAGKPGIRHILELLRDAGIHDVIISLNTKQRRVEEYLGSSLGPVKIRYCYEESNGDKDKRGALGAIAHVVSTFGVPKECIVIGSDNFIYGLDFPAFTGHLRLL